MKFRCLQLKENHLKLCQATWTTHSHSKKFKKLLKNFTNFAPFSVLFSPKKVACSLVKLSEFILEVFILCFPAYLFSFCTISSGLHLQFRYLLANLRKIYVHDVNMMHHKLTAPLNWTARNQYSCNNHYTRINTHFLNQKYTNY